jgi:hypothetical protein
LNGVCTVYDGGQGNVSGISLGFHYGRPAT